MSSQLSTLSKARTTDPETSKEAARLLRTGNSHAFMLLREFAKKSMTAEQAGIQAGLDTTGYWKRVSDLKRAGFIRPRMMDGGKPMRLMTRSGRYAEVLIITGLGRDALRQHKAALAAVKRGA